jgi:hypothetical protein
VAETQDEIRLLKKAAASVGKKDPKASNKGGFPGAKAAKWAA